MGNTVEFHDPANNLQGGVGVHDFPIGVTDSSAVTINPADIAFIVGGQSATVYAAVITNPVPEPSALLLAALGAFALLATPGVWRRRRR